MKVSHKEEEDYADDDYENDFEEETKNNTIVVKD